MLLTSDPPTLFFEQSLLLGSEAHRPGIPDLLPRVWEWVSGECEWGVELREHQHSGGPSILLLCAGLSSQLGLACARGA